MDSLPTPNTPPALPMQRFDVMPYQSDGAIPPAGVGLALLYAIGAALAVGMDAALHDWRPTVRTFSAQMAAQRRMLEIGLAVVIAVAGWIILAPPDPGMAVRQSIERELPVQGVELLREEVPDGRIASWYGWGGYVIGWMTDDGARRLCES